MRAILASLTFLLLLGCAGVPVEPVLDIYNLNLPCTWEEEIDGMGTVMDAYWRDAQNYAGVTAKGPRPRTCFSRYPVVVLRESGEIGRLMGLYNKRNHTAFIAAMGDDPETLRYCTVIHEMLHALLGSGHKQTDAALPKECPRGH